MMAMGEIEKADAALAEADRMLQDNPDDRAVNAGLHVQIAWWRGDKTTVDRELDFLSGYSQLPWDTPLVVNYLLYLRQERAAALQSIHEINERWQAKAHGSARIYFAIIQAVICAQDTEAALGYLRDALAIGKPEGFLRSFVDFGTAIAPLLHEAESRGIESEYVRKLLSIIEAEELQRKLKKPGTSPAGTGLLSQREMEVLQLMSEGLSNQQISEKLMISLSTAKTHVYHIFSKLDASDRLAAVTRARALHLLS